MSRVYHEVQFKILRVHWHHTKQAQGNLATVATVHSANEIADATRDSKQPLMTQGFVVLPLHRMAFPTSNRILHTPPFLVEVEVVS